MEVALLIARLFLALIFGVAGIAKAVDRAGSRQAFIDFGVPERLATPMGWGLPYLEILIALALIPLSTAWLGAIGAFGLLLIFIGGIGLSLARGRSPDCRCFGQLHSEPVGLSTFARNLALAAATGFVIVQGRENPGLSALDWLSDLSAGEMVNLIFAIFVIGLLTFAIIFLSRVLKQQEQLFAGIEAIRTSLVEDGEFAPVIRKEAAPLDVGLPIGAIAPDFSLASVVGDQMSLDDMLSRGKSVLLLFTGPNCWGCKILLPAVRAWQRNYSDLLTVAVLSNGTLNDNRGKMLKYEISHVLLDEGSKVADDYMAAWTPAAVLIHPNGKIASQVTYGDTAIREWVRNLLSSDQIEPDSPINAIGQIPQVSIRYSVREIGELAPRFSLPDLTGKIVNIEDLFGSPTLLFFWHPLCKFCKAMHEDIRKWEEYLPPDAPKLILIASGEVEDIRVVNKDFKSPTLMDPAFEIGPLFGTKYTPSAILIDSEGKIASSLAMEDQTVRALIGLPKAEPEIIAQLI